MSACKREKVLESSQKERPSWVFGIERNYLIVEGKGNTHEEARNAAYIQLKENIVNSVAVNVSSSARIDINENLINNISEYTESFSSSTKISSNFISALRGVSLNNAEDFYWELKRKKDKTREVSYHVKYPYSNADQLKLIKEWEQLDKQMTEEIESLKAAHRKAKYLNELFEIKSRANTLNKLLAEPRKTQAGLVVAKVQSTIDQIEIIEKKHRTGQLYFTIKSNGLTFKTNKTINVTSNCAKVISQTFAEIENAYFIEYETDFCKDTGEDFIELIIKENGTEFKQKFLIPHNENLAQIRILDNIRLLHKTRGMINNETEWQIHFRSFNEVPFEVVAIDMTVERTNQKLLSVLSRRPLVFNVRNNINQDFQGRKDFVLNIAGSSNVNEIEELLSGLINLNIEYRVSGKLMIKSAGQNTVTDYSFENIPVVNVGL